MRPIFVVLLISVSSGCMHKQLAKNTSRQAHSVADVHTQQVLDNLAKFVANPDALPHFSWPNAGAAGVNDSIGGSTGFNFTPHALAGWSAGGDAGRTMNESYTMTPINDPRKLELMRCAYQKAINGCCCSHESCNCPNCESRINNFYFGATSPPTVQITDAAGNLKYRLVAEEVFYLSGENLYKLSVGRDWFVTEKPNEKNEIVYTLDNPKKVFPYDESFLKAVTNSPLFADKEGTPLEKGTDIQAEYKKDTLEKYTKETGKVTLDCVGDCCWFHQCHKSDRPRKCSYVGVHCDTCIWVPECNLDQLTKLTLTILDIATNDPPEGRTKEVVVYLSDQLEAVAKGEAAYSVTATIPIETSPKVLVPTPPVYLDMQLEAANVNLEDAKKELEDAKRKKLQDTTSLNTINSRITVMQNMFDEELKRQNIKPEILKPFKNEASSVVEIQSLIKNLDKPQEVNIDEEGKKKLTQSLKKLKSELEEKTALESSVRDLESSVQDLESSIQDLESSIPRLKSQSKEQGERRDSQIETKSIRTLPPMRTPVPGAGYLEFDLRQRAATGR